MHTTIHSIMNYTMGDVNKLRMMIYETIVSDMAAVCGASKPTFTFTKRLFDMCNQLYVKSTIMPMSTTFMYFLLHKDDISMVCNHFSTVSSTCCSAWNNGWNLKKKIAANSALHTVTSPPIVFHDIFLWIKFWELLQWILLNNKFAFS